MYAGRDNEESPVTFFSWQPTKGKLKFGDQAVVENVRHFEIYLTGKTFTIETNHQALSFYTLQNSWKNVTEGGL